jgi:flagellum-specific ATP synthase
MKYVGFVTKVQGILIESRGPVAKIGEVCRIFPENGAFSESAASKASAYVLAEVVGLVDNTVQLMSYSDTQGISTGDRVEATGHPLDVAVGPGLLGRVLNSRGEPIDGKGPIAAGARRSILALPPPPLTRGAINRRISTGIRAIDGLLAIGAGQRVGVFAGSGVGKSTVQGMIARNTNADVNVIALIGERGREVGEFIQNDLGEEGLKRSCIVVATGDESPLSRYRGAYVATTIAEYFRETGLQAPHSGADARRGCDVMLLFDNVTRFARAMREIGLARGEPAVQRGYTPSVFDSMPKLLERSGVSERGSITAFYAVLVDGDDVDEPISDTARGILDGHIVLSRALAARDHYPAIDVLNSISRLAGAVTGPATKKCVSALRRLIADYAQIEDMLNLGAYKKGTNPAMDLAIDKHEPLENFLIQEVGEDAGIGDTLKALAEIAGLEIPEEEMREAAK